MRSKGFTLVELLVGFSLVVLLFGITIVSIRGFGKKMNLEVEKDRLISVLELAKKKSRAGDKDTCTTLDYYQVSIIDPTSYGIDSFCEVGSGNTTEYEIDTNADITISDFSVQNTIFQPQTQVVTPNCIIVKDASTDGCYKLTIQSSGVINEENLSGEFCSCN